MSKKVIFKENEVEKEIEFDDIDDIESIELLDDDDDFPEGSVRGKITAITPFVCTIVYLLLGFYKDLWHPAWVVFLAIPIVPVLLKFSFKNKNSFVGVLTILITATYFILGVTIGWWHPGWILFLLIPIVGIIFGGE